MNGMYKSECSELLSKADSTGSNIRVVCLNTTLGLYHTTTAVPNALQVQHVFSHALSVTPGSATESHI